MLAADMGAGGAHPVAQQIDQQGARLGIRGDRAAIERESHHMAAIGGQARQRIVSSSTERPIWRTSSRR